MKQESAKIIADSAMISAIGVGSSIFSWVDFANANAGVLGLILSAFFGTCGVIFYIMSYRKQTLAEENKNKMNDMAKQMQKQSKRIRQLENNGKPDK